ncbi:hypothetical protein [Kocuria varians]|uniref:hypothetical protein n=1 Tax=Kocuria varians TaxID=1272 RepID=UPI000ACBDD1C|nr:hypothetical protein [Kocuria varians]
MSNVIRGKFGTPDLEAYVAEIVSAAPPLNDAQRATLAGLLRPVETRGGAAA